ncbi:sigma 54-interacting transcriptional regulator [Oceanidesulfovibrio marinus]|uniref:GAF domain-containing protein n=1 Tax=Oceanidesulfovibrio marinus TaxID=370038 RepID=A0A6P1ZGG7_9BACT|nr:sigma 54-interacting transcriptional regulator [Oceanidesulfovibrio marinus]QJT09525.1 GAF domain-containing protein [Oceanidesulfovibrio marinus]TVM33735.1 sigma-54-dependent Fis family transcriptional regulator [Oceanidesulfovibrio marinus]
MPDRCSEEEKLKECSTGVCRGKIVPLLHDMGRALSEEEDLDMALEHLLRYLKEQMGMQRIMINLYHRETGRIFIHKSDGLTKQEQALGIYFPGEGITGRVVATAAPIVVPSIRDEPDFLNRTGSLVKDSADDMSFLCVPILRGKKVMGTISAERGYDNELMLDKHRDALMVISYMLAQAVELYLVEKVDKVLWKRQALELMDELKTRFRPSNMIGTSKAMMEVYALLRKVAGTRTTVLLLGESGVGKELLANAIHYYGARPDGPVVKFNCAALPESILESELFGHEKGSFTGATQLRKGRFEEADGGTIFLDEVGELPLGVQAKLLRVLQERTFERVGGNESIAVDIRIVAATNKDLAAMVAAGTFREDLYYRLNVFPVLVPPLRERGSDIITIAEHFAAGFAEENGKTINRIATPALNMLMSYHWPGNVRELENVIQRAVILTEDDAIHGYNLPLSLQSPAFPEAGSKCGILETRLAAVEYEMLVEALRLHQGNTTEAARALGLTRRTMGLRMRKYDLSYKQFRRSDSSAPEPGATDRSGESLTLE